MNKFLKILTLTGLTATLSISAYNLKSLDLKTDYKLNAEIDSEASDYLARKTEENNSDAIITFSENGENNVNINENNMDEHNNPIVDTENSAQISPSTEDSETENNKDANTPSTLEESENNLVKTESNSDTNNEENIGNNTLENNSLDINAENDLATDENNYNNTESVTEYISEEKYNEIISVYAEIKEEIEELVAEMQTSTENYKNEQNSLTQEQIDELQAKSQEINTLLSSVEKTLNDMSCTLTGECNTENEINYFNEILKLTNKVNMLQSAMQIYSNPAFRFYQNPYGNIYGFSYYYSPNLDDTNQTENEKENSTEENSNQGEKVDENDNEKTKIKKTFNLPYNLDTYAPTRRNIDTFFNTALLDENGMYNNFTPYGYGPYNNLGYGNFPMNNYNGYNNSNYQNKNEVVHNTSATTPLNVDSTNETNQPNLPEEIGKKRPKLAKNIDTYNAKTMDGNVNTMGGMKVTDYIKQKFNKWFNKKDNQEEVNSYVDNFIDEHQNSETTTTTSIYKDKLGHKEKENLYWWKNIKN